MRLFLLTFMMLLTSCGGNDGGTNARTQNPDSIIRLSDADARGLDPQMVSEIASIRIAMDQFEGLTRFAADGSAEPGLAQDWSISPDGKVWTFRLRPNLRFSDGTAIKSSVFVDALSRIRDEKAGSPHGALFGIIERISAPDAATVVVRLTNPFPQLDALLAHPAMAALPFHRIKAVGEAWTSERPLVTSGAYRLTDWKLNKAITLTASPSWHGGKPETGTIIWRPLDNILAGMRLMIAGGADTATDYPANRQSWLKERYPDLTHSAPYLGTYYYAFNTRKPPFNDVRVRKALSMAIDPKWIATTMIDAGNEPAWGIIPPGLAEGAAYRPQWADWPREKRLAEARSLLSQAGYDKQRPLRFEIRFNSSSEHRRASVAMATMWRDIGVEASLLNSEASLHFDSLKRADFALARSGWLADLPAPENFLAVHRADAGPQNYSGYDDPEYVGALDAALAEPDPPRRLQKMRAAEKILMEDFPVLPLYFYVSRTMVQPDIAGWKDNISNMHPSRTLKRAKR